MKDMKDKVLNYIRKWNMLEPQDQVIVGISGGADSVCLLFVLLEIQKEIGYTLLAVHIHHGLRGPEADADEQYVKALCGDYGVQCLTYHYDVECIAKQRKQSTEEAGRILRREVFARVKEEYQGTKIAMAHHKNDNAETLFLNLARGTGLKGLGGMLPVRNDIIRPLLCVEREEIEKYLAKINISFCTDSTNESNEYTRNKIRNCVLPYFKKEINPQVIEHVNETMEQMREIQLYIKEQVKHIYPTYVISRPEEKIILTQSFQRIPQALQNPLIQICLEEITKQEKNISKNHIEQVKELVGKQVGKQIHLPYHVVASRTYEGILLKQEKCPKETFKSRAISLCIPGVIDEKQLIHGKSISKQISCRVFDHTKLDRIPQKIYTKWFDYDIIKNDLVIRTRQTGDYLIIDQDGSKQKLKSYFVNNKIPSEQRDQILLIAENSHVLWIVGYRMSSAYQIQEHTKQILEIQIDGGEEDGRNN